MGKKNVLVFGGAGGIGASIVKKYIENDFSVIIADIDFENGKKLENKYNDSTFYHVDVLDLNSILSLKEKISKKNGCVTHLICLAGKAYEEEFKGIKELSFDNISSSINLNLISHINIVKAFHPLLINSPDQNKTITLVSSINALKGYGLPAYSSAKAGLIGFMNSVVDELGKNNIRINCISPGTVPTPSTLKEPKDFDKYRRETSLGRLTTTEEIANAAFAITNLITAVVGQNIIIDCGQLVTSNT